MRDEPPAAPLDSYFLRAFDDLNTCRADGGPIPWRDLLIYSKEAGYQGSTRQAFIRIMREMDIGYLKWHNDKKDNADKASARSAKANRKVPPRPKRVKSR